MPLLDDPAEAARRRALLDAPHMAALAAFAALLRRPDVAVPDADPLDGGLKARLLLLLEKPGPASAREGFVSLDNASPTGAAARAFREAAGIDRARLLVWNVCPWWNGTIRFTAAERRAGLAALPALLDRLPELRGAVLVGRQAGAAASLLADRGVPVRTTAHPSPQVRAARPELWHAIPATWEAAARAAGARTKGGGACAPPP